jgi:RimJ/RimL family protein N-acetyltransferase
MSTPVSSPVPPILRDFPEFLETERLLIRAPRPGDGQVMNEAVVESLPELQPWIAWAKTAPSLDDSETFVRQAAAKFTMREDLPMFIYRKSDGAFIGGTGLHRFDFKVPRFEIGYWLRTSAHRSGYMTEAVHTLTAFCFETWEAARIEIRCDARNQASAAVAERVGYTLEARHRHQSRDTAGSLCDMLMYAMLRAEYFARRGG